MRLADKCAVVTGAAGHGIGRAIADAFRAEGAHVATIDIRPQADNDQHGMAAAPLTIKADVSDPDQLIGALEQAKTELGPVHVLVNAAAVIRRKPFLELSLTDWDEVQSVDLRPYFVATQWVARAMIEHGLPGSIINIASINGSRAVTDQAHYCAAKAGVLGLTRAAALELAEHRIRVNAISPGTVETDANRHLLADPGFRALRTGPIPLGRVGQPREIAPVAILLASDESSFITGADFAIDGGQSIS